MSAFVRFLGATVQVASGVLIFQGSAIGVVLGGHVMGGLLWGVGSSLSPLGPNRSAGALAGGFALMIPGAGWLVALAVERITQREPPHREKRPLLVWRDRKVRNNFQFAGNLGPRSSVAEILRGPDAASRRNAILAVKDLDVRAALPLLRKGLQDSDEQVRIFAQNSLSDLLEKFETRIKALESRSQSRPEDVAAAVGLAEQYFELVYLEVAGDEETSAHLLGQAIEILDRAARQAPRNSRVALLQLRYALRQRNREVARRALQRVKTLNVDEQVVLPWEAELAFLERDWRQVKALLAEFVDRRFVNPRIESVAEYWNRGEAVK